MFTCVYNYTLDERDVMSQSLTEELREQESTRMLFKNHELIKKLIYILLSIGRGKGRTSLHDLVRSILQKHGSQANIVSYRSLKKGYSDLTYNLFEKYKTTEAYRTVSEHRFELELKKYTNREVLTSVWIGNHCNDFFLPSYRRNTHRGVIFKGLVFEIQGSVHEEKSKRNRDEYKESFLTSLGIEVIQIKNSAIYSRTTEGIFEGFNDNPPLDSTDKRNVWARIFIETIARCHHKVDDDFLSKCLMLNPEVIKSLLLIIKSHKYLGGKL